MQRKKLCLIVCVLFLCILFTSCSNINNKLSTEEKLENTEKETKKTVKESQKDSSEITKKTQDNKKTEKPINNSKRKELKEGLTEALDDFLIADISGVAMRIGSGYLPDMQMTINRMMYQGEYLYLVDTRGGGYTHRLTFENSKEAYVSLDGGNGWAKVLDMNTSVREGPGSMSGYVTYICLMYAALDAGKECTYDSEKNVYHIELDSKDMMSLDLRAIKSTIENKDRFDEFNIYLDDGEVRLNSFKSGINNKRYEFGFEDKNVFVKEETGADLENPDFSVVWIRTIIDEKGPIEEMDVIKFFEEIKSTVKE